MWFDFAHQPGDEGDKWNKQCPIPNSQYFDFAQYKCPIPNALKTLLMVEY